jgi:hypothetical protein
MTALKSVAQCDSNSICTSKKVLRYLYIQNETAHFLAKDTFNLGQILSKKNEIIILKDSLITNRNEALNISNNTANLYKSQLEFTEKTLTKKVKKFQFTTIVSCVAGFTSTLYLLFH